MHLDVGADTLTYCHASCKTTFQAFRYNPSYSLLLQNKSWSFADILGRFAASLHEFLLLLFLELRPCHFPKLSCLPILTVKPAAYGHSCILVLNSYSDLLSCHLKNNLSSLLKQTIMLSPTAGYNGAFGFFYDPYPYPISSDPCVPDNRYHLGSCLLSLVLSSLSGRIQITRQVRPSTPILSFPSLQVASGLEL